MSEANVQSKPTPKPKGLGRGLGSLLGPTSEGAFSKTTPAASVALEDFTSDKSPVSAQVREPVLPSGGTASAAPRIETEVATSPAPTEAPVPLPVVTSTPPHHRVWQVGIEKIFPNANQPRQIFEKGPLQELANSIKEKGIIQPLLVRRSADGDGEYELIAGERRWRAAQLAGLKDVPVLIKDSDEQEVLELALIENIQRENLNAVEEAEAYDFLVKKYNLTQNELAQKVGKDRATVANMLRILQLQPVVRQMVSRGELSLGMAKVLLSVSDARLQQDLAARAKNDSLSVRALEKLVAKTKAEPEKGTEQEDARSKAARHLQEELQKLIGSKVNLDYDKGKGRIVIHFYSDSELNQIADTLRDSWRS